jgi:flagellar biosynthesis chaperone FliJ
LRETLKTLQDRRVEKTTAFARIRSTRETLEKLREKAVLKHTRAMLKLDQKELDENSRITFAREIIERAVGMAE